MGRRSPYKLALVHQGLPLPHKHSHTHNHHNSNAYGLTHKNGLLSYAVTHPKSALPGLLNCSLYRNSRPPYEYCALFVMTVPDDSPARRKNGTFSFCHPIADRDTRFFIMQNAPPPDIERGHKIFRALIQYDYLEALLALEQACGSGKTTYAGGAEPQPQPESVLAHTPTTNTPSPPKTATSSVSRTSLSVWEGELLQAFEFQKRQQMQYKKSWTSLLRK